MVQVDDVISTLRAILGEGADLQKLTPRLLRREIEKRLDLEEGTVDYLKDTIDDECFDIVEAKEKAERGFSDSEEESEGILAWTIQKIAGKGRGDSSDDDDGSGDESEEEETVSLDALLDYKKKKLEKLTQQVDELSFLKEKHESDPDQLQIDGLKADQLLQLASTTWKEEAGTL
eukprot:TRINITY_DN2223_c0_g1_i1.p1 TRINITY_DN2223_c0_g1~~TRINITY_DN2223_c0_g1_i1.p1  ORF type:complete len:184 (+),score=83.02 TRINITY_DN2223_c0_g1_i1:28-552(+)